MAFRPNGLFVETDDRSSGDDDDISLTSTVEEGGDYDVEELLFEREDPQEPGKPQFLIKWAGYPLDQCTVCSFHFQCDGPTYHSTGGFILRQNFSPFIQHQANLR